MTQHSLTLQVACLQTEYQSLCNKLCDVITQHRLPLQLSWQPLPDLKNKTLMTLGGDAPIVLVTQTRAGMLAHLFCLSAQNEVIKAGPYWHKRQQRIVAAGRKSELILQACKPNNDSVVIDATAGFGHDSLILASSGATVWMVEKNPVMALLLLLEQQRMQAYQHWQALISRLHIIHADALHLDALSIPAEQKSLINADVIYLDPMFPAASYNAKVSKTMQVLHQLAKPPAMAEQLGLMQWAKSRLNVDTKRAKVIVKRPKDAVYFADETPKQSWQNDVVRFDGYW